MLPGPQPSPAPFLAPDPGLVRRLGRFGRLTLPKAIRDRCGLAPGTPVLLVTQDAAIVLMRWQPGCVFCGQPETAVRFRGRPICAACLGALLRSDIR